MNFLPFDFVHATDEQWARLIAIRQQIASETNPNESLPDADMLRKSLEAVARDPHNDFQVYFALEDDRLIGYASLNRASTQNPHYSENRHVGTVSIFVPKDQRRQGIGTQLLNHLRMVCLEHDVQLMQGTSTTPDGNAFAEKFGAEIATLVKENRLYLADVDWDKLTQQVKASEARNPDVTVETFEGLISEDDAEIAPFAHLYTEVTNQIPYESVEGTDHAVTVESIRLEDEEHRNIGIQLWTKVTREADGTLSGLTEIIYHPSRGIRVVQGLTGVRMAYRGRGLGKWLKADMLLFVREHYPNVDYIMTMNSNVNAAMLAINDWLGFRFYQQQTVYKLPV